jgi:prolyl-tRNA synthetase
MKWTEAFIPTLRQEPADTESISHTLMLRAGLIRRLMSGVYCYLPLGTAALNKVINIVREEMNKTGAIEVYLSVLQPEELWIQSERLEAFGQILCKFRDRTGRLNILGPTHEEVIVNLVKNDLYSYRQLPLTLYQIQVKIRDEPRPRFGVIRSREFIMKDAYSFETDWEGLEKTYRSQYDAYCRIFTRCGLKFYAVEADPGLMGGDVSHEFIVPSPFGEDKMVICSECGYAANLVMAQCSLPKIDASVETQEFLPPEEVDTPNCITVEDVARYLSIKPEKILKSMIYLTPEGPVGILIRGDYEINETKLARVLGTLNFQLASPEKVEEITKAPVGSCGPVGLRIKLIADLSVQTMVNFVAGANKPDKHIMNINTGRDFTPSQFADVRVIGKDDPCPQCSAGIEILNGIEVGHIFKLGTRYSDKMQLTYVDNKGVERPIIMGCYGIGINRIIAAAIESNHDENGIVWPKEIAPYQVHLISININDHKIREVSSKIYQILKDGGLEVLWDDRDTTPGVKFVDADLIGIPIRVVVGTKTLQNNTVDVKMRPRKEEQEIPVENILEGVKKILKSYVP